MRLKLFREFDELEMESDGTAVNGGGGEEAHELTPVRYGDIKVSECYRSMGWARGVAQRHGRLKRSISLLLTPRFEHMHGECL